MEIYLNNSKISHFGHTKHFIGLGIDKGIIHNNILSDIFCNNFNQKAIQKKINEFN